MVWVAVDRAIRGAESFGLPAPLERWRALRTRIHETVCREGYSEKRNSFVQYFGGDTLDASLLLLPLVGFLPPEDPRIIGTVEAIGEDLMVDGLIRRYHTHETQDGLSGTEGVFLACSFWYVDNLVLQGRQQEARDDVRAAAGADATMSGCWPRNMIRSAAASLAISRRRSRIWR